MPRRRHPGRHQARSPRPLAAREIIDDLTRRQVKLSIGGSLHDPTDPVGRLLFNVRLRIIPLAAFDPARYL
ncbi:MAG: hypothetical protein ACR2KO_14150 [Geodermatophilaceae bacterium]|jgi:hypothetical protein